MRIIPVHVTDEYVRGDGVVVGAARSHDDVALRLEFGQMWQGLTMHITWFNALGENPVNTLLATNLLADGETMVYIVPIPAEPKAIEGHMMMTIAGYTLDETGKQEETATLTTTAYFRILPSDWVMAEDSSITAPLATQLQGEIDSIKKTISDAGTARDEARSAADEAEKSAQAAQTSEETAAQYAKNAQEQVQAVEAAAKEAKEGTAESVIRAEDAAIAAKSWAQGGTGTRAGEDKENARFYCEKAETLVDGTLRNEYYRCTGKNDDIAIVATVNNFLTAMGEWTGTPYRMLRLVVSGEVGLPDFATNGSGTQSNPYSFFNFYCNSAYGREVIIDWSKAILPDRLYQKGVTAYMLHTGVGCNITHEGLSACISADGETDAAYAVVNRGKGRVCVNGSYIATGAFYDGQAVGCLQSGDGTMFIKQSTIKTEIPKQEVTFNDRGVSVRDNSYVAIGVRSPGSSAYVKNFAVWSDVGNTIPDTFTAPTKDADYQRDYTQYGVNGAPVISAGTIYNTATGLAILSGSFRYPVPTAAYCLQTEIQGAGSTPTYGDPRRVFTLALRQQNGDVVQGPFPVVGFTGIHLQFYDYDTNYCRLVIMPEADRRNDNDSGRNTPGARFVTIPLPSGVRFSDATSFMVQVIDIGTAIGLYINGTRIATVDMVGTAESMSIKQDDGTRVTANCYGNVSVQTYSESAANNAVEAENGRAYVDESSLVITPGGLAANGNVCIDKATFDGLNNDYSLLGDGVTVIGEGSSASGGARIVAGSYYGTGTFGEDNPCELTFDFEPKLVIVQNTFNRANATTTVSCHATCVFIRGEDEVFSIEYRQTENYYYEAITQHVTWDNKTIRWYANVDAAVLQLNLQGSSYEYIAIG